MIRKPIFLFLLFVFSAVLVSLLMAFVTDQSSSLVIGQPTFMNGWFNQANPAAGVMDTPEASYYDGTRFYVADSTNNRVLIYTSIPVTTGAPANVVVGQPDFLSFCQNQGNSSPGANTLRNPSGVYSDGTRLYIADQDNNRVLIYNSIPVTNDTPADVVVGQVDFVSWDSNQGGTPEANTVYVPQSVSGTGSYLFISDWGNDRVLIYNSIPVTNNAPANVVVGQMNFTGGSANQGGLTSANSLSSPVAVGSNGTNLCIADRDNNRVLIYNSIPVTNNAPATLVIGQNTMTGNAQNYGGLSASSLSSPYGVYAIGATILIADYSNSRVLIYNSLPVTNGAPANVEVGQSSMNSSVPNQGGQPAANTLRSPMFVSAKGTTLFIADTYNNRALIFDSMPVTNNANASVAVGQTSFAGGQINGGGVVSANSLHNPAGLATDGTNLYSADPANNRVLIYDGIPTTSNPAASVVVGQSSMSGSSANQGGTVSANTLNNPWGVASDGTKLYISDQNNNRVLIYNSIPVTNNANASLVLGQISMGVNNSNEGGSTANNTLYGPEGICVSGAYLFVVDTDNNRVLIYNPIPTSSNSPAYVILGQPNTSTNISNDGGETASTMSFPSGVCYDGTRLFIADYENNRVLIYNSIPVTTGAPANVVVGQAGFTTSTNGSGPAALSGPQAVYSNGTTLFIADSGNNRILVFNTIPTTNGASADEALGQPTTSGNSANQSQCLPSANSLYQPSGLSGSASQLYVADSNNSRILSFSVNTPTLTITNTPTVTVTPTLTPIPNSTPCAQPLIYDSGGTDNAAAVALDSSGNVYVGGTCPNGANTQFRIIKYDTNGNALWNSTCYPGANAVLYGLAIDSSGDVFAAGSQQSTSRIYLTLKLNSAGVSQWAKTYDGTGGLHDNDALAAAVDPTNTYLYVTGRSYTTTNWDIMTLKYDMNGNLQANWPAKYDSGGNHDQGFGIACDASGNIYVGGESDVSSVAHGRILRYNAGTTVISWNVPYNSGNLDQFNGVAVDPTGTYVYAEGYSSNGSHNIGRLIQFGTASGGISFNITYNNAVTAVGAGVAVDGQGNIYTVLQDSAGKYHTVKYGPAGSVLWDQTFTRGLGVDQSNAVAVGGMSGSDVYVTGQSSNGTNNDFLTLKYDYNSNCPYTYTFTSTSTPSPTTTPSPTPTSCVLNLSTSGATTTLASGTYNFCGVTIGGGASPSVCYITGPATINVSGNVVLNNNGIIELQDTNNSVSIFVNGGSFIMNSGSEINASNVGAPGGATGANGTGSGKGSGSNSGGGGGAGHWGIGGTGANGGGGGVSYDSPYPPTQYGSGGGGGNTNGGGGGGQGGLGGGYLAVSVTNAGSVTLNGVIYASGYSGYVGTSGNDGGGGGGSGGDIFISSTTNIQGTGILDVSGGAGGNGAGSGDGGGGGAGGIINLCATNYGFTGTFNLAGGNAGLGGTGSTAGSNGAFYICGAVATPTFTFTSTNSPTQTQTQTPTFTQTQTTTFTQTQTPTFTQTQTPTFTQTQTPTFTQTQTPTATPTFTQTQTSTYTPTQTPTFTQTQTPTFTQTQTPTYTQTQTPTFTQSQTPTFTQTQTPTFTQTATPTFSQTLTPTFTQTATPTFTQTQTPTFTQTQTPTFTQTQTPTFTQTATPTFTQTATPTLTQTQTPIFTQTQTLTFTQTATPTFTQTATPTFTQTHTPTFTQTQTPTFTQTQTPTITQTQTPTFSQTLTPTVTETQTPTLTSTSTPTVTSTLTPTMTRTSTPTLTYTNTPSATSTWTSSATPTNTSTATSTKTSTSTPTSSFTATWTPTPSMSPTNTFTHSPTITYTWTLTPTISFTPTITLTPSPTGSVTNTPTPNVPMYLSENYFNPATGATLGIDVLVAQGGEVKIVVFNMLAEEVDKLVDQTLNPGSYHFTWDGRNRYGDMVGNGVYLVVIEQPSGNFIRKVIVLK